MTFQTTLNCTLDLTPEQMAVLDGRCELMSYLERIYYVDKVTHKKDLNQLKSQYIDDYDINARQFNALRIAVDGKIASTLALAKEDLLDTEQALKKAKRKLSGILKTKDFYEKKSKIKPLTELDLTFYHQIPAKLWYARQRIMKLEKKVKKLKDMIATGNPHICFGGRKLFLQQFQIEGGNNLTKFKTVGQVKKAWKDKRKQQFTLVGGGDETAGNQNCQISYDKYSQSFSLKINVAPKAIKLQDRYITVPLAVYSGQDMLLAAMDNQQALTYRFYKDFDKNQYRVFISFDKCKSKPTTVTKPANFGAIGIDINHGFVSVVETDLYGNRKETFDMPLDLKGLSSHQSQDKIAVMVKQITDWAKHVQKPIVLEDLDFSAKKKQMNAGYNTKYNQMLSSFAYNKIKSLFEGRCFDKGIELITANPAYSSVIGRLKYKHQGYKISVHQGAAWVLARRGMKLKEKERVFSVKHGSWIVAEQSDTKQADDFWKQAQSSWMKYVRGRQKSKQALRVRSDKASAVSGTPLSQTGSVGHVQLCPRSK